MKKLYFPLVLILLITANLAAASNVLVEVPLAELKPTVEGAPFSVLDDTGLHFYRFDETILKGASLEVRLNPVKAKTTSGVILAITSNAKQIRLYFRFNPDDDNRSSQFAVYRDNEYQQEISISKDKEECVIDLSGDGQTEMLHELVLPSWSNPVLTKVEITAGAKLGPRKDSQQKLIVLGDSISHGTGQGSSTARTYPFIAARKLDLELVNLAVGGAKISPPVADLLQYIGGVKAIWILVGYNNWQGASQDIETIGSEYQLLLDTIREHKPDTPVYCCTLTYTKRDSDQESGVSAKAVRTAVAETVQRRIQNGDDAIFLIRSESFTNESYLRESSDPVHFSEAGAGKFANDLVRIVSADMK